MSGDLAPFRVEAGEVPHWVEIRAHTTGLWVKCRRCAFSTALYHFALSRTPELLRDAIEAHAGCRS